MRRTAAAWGAILLMVILAIGCNSSDQVKDKPRFTGQNSADSSERKVYSESSDGKISEKNTDKKLEQKVSKQSNELDRENLKGDSNESDNVLIIKSNNPVEAGSNQRFIDEVDQAADELIKSLDSIDNIKDRDLDF